MSLPRYKVTMLAISLGIACTFVGCSSNPSKKKSPILDHAYLNKPILIQHKKP